jgi:hypothetical protein
LIRDEIMMFSASRGLLCGPVERVRKGVAMAEPMDKSKKIKLIVACVALVVGGVLIVNQVTGGAVKEVVAPTPPPPAPKIDETAKKTYEKRQEKLKKQIDSGEITISGS